MKTPKQPSPAMLRPLVALLLMMTVSLARAVDYPVVIAGVQVTNLNSMSVKGDGIRALDTRLPYSVRVMEGVDGSYTVVLRNAVVDGTVSGTPGIQTTATELIVKTAGSGYSAQVKGAAAAIQGVRVQVVGGTTDSGVLHLEATAADGCAVKVSGQSLTVDGKVHARGGLAAFQGWSSATTLTLSSWNSGNGLELYAQGGTSAFSNFKQIQSGDSFAKLQCKLTDAVVLSGSLTDYPLDICDVHVTSLNAANIVASGISALDDGGFDVSFDLETATLLLHSALIDACGLGVDAIYIGSGLYRSPISINTVKAGAEENWNRCAIKSDLSGVVCDTHSDVKFNFGTSTFSTIEAGRYGVHFFSDKTHSLSFEGYLEVNSQDVAIYAEGGRIVIDRTKLHLVSPEGTIKGFSSKYMTTTSYKASLETDESDRYSLQDSDGNLVTDAYIGITVYPVKVAGVLVTEFNRGDVTGPGIVKAFADNSGVIYTPGIYGNPNILELRNVAITATGDDSGIEFDTYLDGNGTMLLPTGNNTVSAASCGITVKQPHSVSIDAGVATGQLTINSGGDGIYIMGTPTVKLIQNVKLNINAGGNGIRMEGLEHSSGYLIFGGNYENNNEVTIDAAEAAITGSSLGVYVYGNNVVSLRGKAYGAVTQVRQFLWNFDVRLVTPAIVSSVYFGDETETLLDPVSMTPTTDWVEIRHVDDYFLVADVLVDELNMNDPIVGEGIKGTVTYDAATQTLTLDNATITNCYDAGISLLKGVKEIKLKGTNTIVPRSMEDLSEEYSLWNASETPVTISGPGSLSLYSLFNGCGHELTLQDCTLSHVAIINVGKLSIDNCTVDGVIDNRRHYSYDDDGNDIFDIEGMEMFNTSDVVINIKNSRLTADVDAFNDYWHVDNTMSGIRNFGDITFSQSHAEASGVAGYDGCVADYSGTTYESSLTIDGSTLKLRSTDTHASAQGYNLTLTGDTELTGQGTLYTLMTNPKTHYFEVRDYGTLTATVNEVVFEVPAALKDFGITIGSTAVTGLNCDDVKDEGLKSGRISYDEASATLTLDNISLETPIRITGDRVKQVQLVGNNSITLSGNPGFSGSFTSPLTLTSADGTGTLSLVGDFGSFGAVYAPGGLSLEHVTVTATTTSTVFDAGVTLSGTELSISDATLNVTGGVKGVKTLVGDGNIVTPLAAYFDAAGDVVQMVDGVETLVTTPLTIETVYVLQLGETPVSRSNRHAVADAGLKGGTVSYDPATTTLTLDNITYEGEGWGTAISAWLWDGSSVTLQLKGANKVSGVSQVVGGTKLVVTSADGTGSLTGTAQQGINAETLTISNCAVDLAAEYSGLSVNGGALTLDKAAVSIKCSDEEWGQAVRAQSIVLADGETLVKPAEAVFNAESQTLEVGGATVAEVVYSAAKKGDVNGDGSINITDVTLTISYILGQSPADFNPSAADLDGNATVNITDVTLLIDLVLTK